MRAIPAMGTVFFPLTVSFRLHLVAHRHPHTSEEKPDYLNTGFDDNHPQAKSLQKSAERLRV